MIKADELVDNEFLRQFEVKVDEHIAIVEYSLQERKIFLTKLIIPEAIDNEDFVTTFLKIVLDSIEERNLSVMPTCPLIAKFIKRNRQYKKLLPVGIRI